ncbi:hypothetical protein Tco_1344305 [Tanacetum coccineum]
MDGSSSQPHTEQPMSDIHSFPTEDMYSPKYSDSFQHTARKDSPVEVAAPPPKSKSSRGRQKRTDQNEDAPRSTAWTNEEEIALFKGWVHVSENSFVGNAKRESGFWTEVLRYLENKTKAPRRRTYEMKKEEHLDFFGDQKGGGGMSQMEEIRAGIKEKWNLEY